MESILNYAREESALPLNAEEEIRFDVSGPLSDTWVAAFGFRDDLRIDDKAVAKTELRYADCCLGLYFYGSYDENQGEPVTTLGFELDLIGLTKIGSRSLRSF